MPLESRLIRQFTAIMRTKPRGAGVFRWATLAAALVLVGIIGARALAPRAPERIKIGFLVKMPEQAWFINEISAAQAAGREQNFDVLAMGAQDGERLMNAIDNLAAQGAQGFVVCAPDVRLGPAVVARSKVAGLKVVTVDDQFQGADGKPLTTVPHLGMSGYKIGQQVGRAIAAEMRRRHWTSSEVGAIALTNNELPTAVERVSGTRDALLESGFSRNHIFDAPQRSTDTEAASNAAAPVFSRESGLKKWIIFGLNEETVLGAVRASEQFGLSADQVIGIGINGSATAVAEFSKSSPTGFAGTIAVSSTLHGRQSALNLVDWIRRGRQPRLYTETTGTLMTRQNWRQVKADLHL